MPKVSVIIPFYNVESYIDECLKSVVNQTLKDIEIIVVNDASKDNSLKIVQKYQKQDKRIKLISIEEQQGQGFARNRALEIATGEYIGFVDSDDFIDNKMFETMYHSAIQNDTDITMCLARKFDDVNNQYIESSYYSLTALLDFKDNVFSAEETKENILDINVALWNKIYKKEYLDKINEKLPEGYIFEDLPFFFGTYLKAKSINIVWQYLYSYRINRINSTMQQFNNKILDRIQMVSLSYEKIKNITFLNDYKKQVQAWIINDLFHRYSLLEENLHQEYFFLMKKVFQNLEIENINDDYWKSVYHFQGYLLVINNTFENFRNKVFNEYLDIHKLEDRLRSEIHVTSDIDNRFELIYKDIKKNYEYTENIVSNSNSRIDIIESNISNISNSVYKIKEETKQNIDGQIVNLNNQTDEKISNVYNQIHQNSEYHNEKNNQLYKEVESNKKILDEQVSNIYNKLEETKNILYSEDSKVYNYIEETKKILYSEDSKVYNYIEETKKILNEEVNNLSNYQASKNNELEKCTNDLYNEIKDVSYVVNDNYTDLQNKQMQIIEEANDKFKTITETQTIIKEGFDKKLEDIKSDSEYRIIEISSKLNKNNKTIDDKVENVKKQQIYYKSQMEQMFEELQNNFINKLKLQQEKYEKEIKDMEKKLGKLEEDLIEVKKSPIQKFIDKHKKNQEK